MDYRGAELTGSSFQLSDLAELCSAHCLLHPILLLLHSLLETRHDGGELLKYAVQLLLALVGDAGK